MKVPCHFLNIMDFIEFRSLMRSATIPTVWFDPSYNCPLQIGVGLHRSKAALHHSSVQLLAESPPHRLRSTVSLSAPNRILKCAQVQRIPHDDETEVRPRSHVESLHFVLPSTPSREPLQFPTTVVLTRKQLQSA